MQRPLDNPDDGGILIHTLIRRLWLLALLPGFVWGSPVLVESGGTQFTVGEGGEIAGIGVPDKAPMTPRVRLVLGPSGRQEPVLKWVSESRPEAGALLVRYEGRDPRDAAVKIALTCISRRAQNDVQLVLEAHNTGHGHYAPFNMGLLIEWGGARGVHPGQPVAPGRRRSVGWIGGEENGAAFLLAAEIGRMRADTGTGWTLVQGAVTTLPPGQRRESAFSLRVATPGIEVALQSWRQHRGAVTGELTGTVLEGDGRPATGVWVEVSDPQGGLLTRTRTLPGGIFSFRARPGTVHLVVGGRGRVRSKPVEALVSIRKAAQVRLVATSLGQALLTAFDGDGKPIGAVVQFTRLDGAAVDLGPPGGFPTAGNRVVLAGDEMTVDLPPGRYEAHFSAGPDQATSRVRFTVNPGGSVQVSARLARVFDKADWRAVDFRVEGGALSAGQRKSWCDAAGMDGWYTAADTNHLALGLSDEGVFSQQSVFGEATFAAYNVRDLGLAAGRAAAILAAMKLRNPGALRAVFRPRAAGWAYFERFRFDPTQAKLPSGFSLDFELLELGSIGTVAQR